MDIRTAEATDCRDCGRSLDLIVKLAGLSICAECTKTRCVICGRVQEAGEHGALAHPSEAHPFTQGGSVRR